MEVNLPAPTSLRTFSSVKNKLKFNNTRRPHQSLDYEKHEKIYACTA